ncbi:hypothetical protein [Alteraurantiacibacter aquimixticola]|uniref:Porin n=1 Tax=Alteraurantiacibacter aquimixticola TaxID=2489173 RepID=A0A4T3EWW7_9SPHN|nr:hypothetical protein [Alteraurantiacibacter aquimixticola]TIX48993.1 hypothetical protein E5222_14780 [Alteraurantiacibacter aquimixticola]
MKNRLAAGIAGIVMLVGVPSAGLAVGLLDADAVAAARNGLASFTPSSADPRMVRMLESRGVATSGLVRFTPAGSDATSDRSVTVAVRVDEETAQAISVRNAISSARSEAVAEASAKIATSRYNLGLARGYRSFAQAAPALSQPLSNAAIPDLSEFEPAPGVREEPSRFAARIALEEAERPATSAPQTLDSLGDQSLDVAGSYRLTRNLDVRAGIRYQQDRDGRTTLPDLEQKDSQAVYIGTQFRF